MTSNNKEKIKRQIQEAINNDPAKTYIDKAFLFGSYLHDTQKEDSDIDILIEFKPTTRIGFFEFAQIQRRISDFLGKKVDLLTPPAISEFFKEKIINEAELIYG